MRAEQKGYKQRAKLHTLYMRGLVNMCMLGVAPPRMMFSARQFIIHFSALHRSSACFRTSKTTLVHMHHDVPSTLSSPGETIYLMDILKLAERAHLHAPLFLLPRRTVSGIIFRR
jgi:hypothetical protein